MASQIRKGASNPREEVGGGVVARVTESIGRSAVIRKGVEAAAATALCGKKLLRSTGKAAWIAGTTFLVLVVPLIIEMDREQQMNELEMQQASLLGTPGPSSTLMGQPS